MLKGKNSSSGLASIRSKINDSSRSGQTSIILIVIALILLIVGIIVVPRVIRRFNIKLPNIPRPNLSAVDVSPTPISEGNVLPAQTTPTPVISTTLIPTTNNSQPFVVPPSGTPQGKPTTILSPTKTPSPTGVYFIQGEIRIVNNYDHFVEKVEVVYCGEANIAQEDQICIVTDFKNLNGEANTVWYLYSSFPHNFYHYQLNFDSNEKPMEIGHSYTIAWIQATVEGQTYRSDEEWVRVRFPGKQNFIIRLPPKL